MVTKISIRAFRAIADPKAAQRFVEGHSRVLRSHGVTKVTSLNERWLTDPSVFVILVESPDGKKVYGGARIHAATAKVPLPIEEATGFMDGKIYEVVAAEKHHGTGELCGLWNSIEVAGMGIGSFFATMAGVVIADQIGLTSIFALCAPYTVPFAESVGCQVLKDVGNNGTFYYPKIDLLATVVLLQDSPVLKNADKEVAERIRSLRKDPVQIVNERPPGKKSDLEIHYNLAIPDADKKEFKLREKVKN